MIFSRTNDKCPNCFATSFVLETLSAIGRRKKNNLNDEWMFIIYWCYRRNLTSIEFEVEKEIVRV